MYNFLNLEWKVDCYQHFPKQTMAFTCLQYRSFENTAGKGEIASIEQCLLLPQCFLPIWRIICHFYQTWNHHLQIRSVWKSLKFVILERVRTNDFTCNLGVIITNVQYFSRCQHLSLVQIESICRWQLQCSSKMVQFVCYRVENIVGKTKIFNSFRSIL